MTRNLVLWLVIAAVLFMVFQNFSQTSTADTVSYSDFVHQVEDGRVRRVEVSGSLIRVETDDNQSYNVVRPQVSDLDLMPLIF